MMLKDKLGAWTWLFLVAILMTSFGPLSDEQSTEPQVSLTDKPTSAAGAT